MVSVFPNSALVEIRFGLIVVVILNAVVVVLVPLPPVRMPLISPGGSLNRLLLYSRVHNDFTVCTNTDSLNRTYIYICIAFFTLRVPGIDYIVICCSFFLLFFFFLILFRSTKSYLIGRYTAIAYLPRVSSKRKLKEKKIMNNSTFKMCFLSK